MKIALPDSVCSPQDVLEVADELAGLARRLRPGVHGAHSKASLNDLSPAARELLGTQKHEPTAVTVKELVGGLEELYRNSPKVVITMAAPASDDMRRTLTAWFRKNISPLMLVQVQFNRAVLGGLVVRMGSHIYDWSFRSKLTDSHTNIAEVLGRV